MIDYNTRRETVVAGDRLQTNRPKCANQFVHNSSKCLIAIEFSVVHFNSNFATHTYVAWPQ